MENSILYYPTIDFNEDDYEWLWTASLLWDKIYRIVPPGYELHDCKNVRILCESGDIGIGLSPVPYAKNVGTEFSAFLDNYGDAAGLEINNYTPSQKPIRVHKTKVDETLRNYLFYSKRIFDYGDDWVYFKPEEANMYMTFLAKYMAEKNSLSLYTNERTLWTTSTYYLSEGQLQADCFIGDNWGIPSAEALASLMIADVFPVNILDVRPKDILNFREKRKDERKQFLDAINHFRNALDKATSPEILREIIYEEQKSLDYAKNEYTRSMDLLNVTKFTGVLTTLLTIIGNILSYSPKHMSSTTLIGTGVLTLSILTGLASKRLSKKKKTPYSYLANIRNDFSTSYDINTKWTNLEKYTYALYRDIEEFIND